MGFSLLAKKRPSKNKTSRSPRSSIHGVEYRKWSLRFLNRQLEGRFEEHHFQQNWQHMRLALLVSVLVFLVVSLLDYVLIGQLSYHAVGVRILSYVPLVIVLLVCSYTKHWRLIFAASPFAVVIAGLALVIPLTPYSLHTNTLYFVAMLLFLLFAYGVMRARFLWVVRAGLAITLGYQLTLLWLSPVSGEVFVGRTIVLIAANIIGIFAAYTVEFFARRDFVQTVLMADSADSLALTISERDQHLRHVIAASPEVMLFQVVTNTSTESVIIGTHHPNLSRWLHVEPADDATVGEWFHKVTDADNLVRAIEETVRMGQQQEFSFTVNRSDGATRVYKLILIGSQSVSRERRSALGILMDQTDEVNAQAKQKELLQQKTKFLDIASHQLNTPLTMMRWGLGELKTPTRDAQRDVVLAGMQEAVERMTRTLHDVITATGITKGGVQLTEASHTVGELIERVMRNFAQNEQGRVRIRVRERLRGTGIVADLEKITFVFTRLIENALAYSSEEVEWVLEQRGGKLWGTVQDRGFGVLPSERPYLFQLFYRGHRATVARPNQAGMSLYMARHYITAHRGTISVDTSQPGETLFIVKLPIIDL
jgi:signal transduction histidine kinase